MATYIKAVGCACPECGPDPCDPGCPCNFDELSPTGDGWTGTQSEDFAAGSNFILAQTINVDCPNTNAASIRVKVYADAVSIFDSGVVTTAVAGTAAVPAGTTTITVEIIATTAVIDTTDVHVYC